MSTTPHGRVQTIYFIKNQRDQILAALSNRVATYGTLVTTLKEPGEQEIDKRLQSYRTFVRHLNKAHQFVTFAVGDREYTVIKCEVSSIPVKQMELLIPDMSWMDRYNPSSRPQR